MSRAINLSVNRNVLQFDSKVYRYSVNSVWFAIKYEKGKCCCGYWQIYLLQSSLSKDSPRTKLKFRKFLSGELLLCKFILFC